MSKAKVKKPSGGLVCLCKKCAAKYRPAEIESLTFGPLNLHKDDSRRQQVIAIFDETAEKMRELGFGVSPKGAV